MTSPIAFIGLGHMGLGIAGRLLDAGHALRVHNRTADRALPLVERGAQVARTPADAVTAGGVAVTMVSDDAALEAVTLGADGIAAALGDGVHLGMSTVSPALARRLAEEHARHGGAYVSAPVFGRPEVAAQGKLWGCVSGDAAARARVAPLVAAVTRGHTDFGDDPGAAAAAKIGGNLLILAATAALTDALALGAAHGLAPADLAALYGETLFASPLYANYGQGVAAVIASGRPRPPGFSTVLARKDAALAVDAGRATGTALHLAGHVLDRLDAAVAAGLGDADVTSLPLA
ncbi:MAG: NAD(P)-dependent oxidoreductase [Gemmatirosa sp.]|nr:NAD(P)-dependent oxidoreductase [Gemmatirosa sp.]